MHFRHCILPNMIPDRHPRKSPAFLILLGVAIIAVAYSVVPTLFRLPPDRPGCDMPIRYGISEVDDRFPLGRKAFLGAALEAEAVWERGLGKDVFLYDPRSSFRITAIFDDRQKMTIEARELQDTVASYETESAKIADERAELLALYERDKKRFEADAAKYEEALEEYNAEVAKWNEMGGAPPEEYEKLEKTKKKLEEEGRQLTESSKDLQALAKRVNALAKTINTKAGDVNENIAEFRERYGEPRPFVQGLYTPPLSSIEIFQFEGRDDLRLVLAHELGHALGIEEHVDNDRSLMYYLMGGQDMLDPAITEEDIAAYATVCPERGFSRREAIAKYLVQTPLEDMDPLELFVLFLR